MIIKLIETKAKTKEADRRARYLTRYLATADRRWLGLEAPALDHGLTLSTYMSRQPEPTLPTGERVLFKGAAINGTAQAWDNGVTEIERRLAKRSAKIKKPVRHGVLSLREGERLTEDQCIEAVATLAAELRCEPSAILWAAHGDTDNFHLHIMFVTVDAETGEAVPFGRGPKGHAQWKEAMQRAIARIEYEQKLQAEAGGRYEVRNGHVVRRAEPSAAARSAAPAPARKRTPLRREVLAFEEQSGFMSFTRHAQEAAGPILDAATSWPDLHRDLAAHGIGIRSKDNGGELYAGADHVKLSKIDRRHSWTQLVKPDRLGPYTEPAGVELVPYDPPILDAAKAAAWLKRCNTEQAIGAAIDRRVAALIAAREAALAEMRASIAAHRDDLAGFDADPRLRRDIAAAWPRLGADTIASLGAAFDARIAAVRVLRRAVAGADDLDAIDLDCIGALDGGIAAPWYGERGAPPVAVIQGYEAERRDDVVRYWREGDTARSGQPAMVDAGAIIWVNDGSDETIAAALRLAAERYGRVAGFGDRAYLARCAAVAGELGVEMTTITPAEAIRRTKTVSGRHETRVKALATAKARQNEDLRQWARAYARATPGKVAEPEERRRAPPMLRHLAGHETVPTVQALHAEVGQQARPDVPKAGRQSRREWQRDAGGIE